MAGEQGGKRLKNEAINVKPAPGFVNSQLSAWKFPSLRGFLDHSGR